MSVTGVYVVPKRDCPHILEIDVLDIKDRFDAEKFSTPCGVCGDGSENWFCLSCETVLCSRFVNAHMAQHNESTQHPVAFSYTDASFWCYDCESYITNPDLQVFAMKFSTIKHGSEEDGIPNQFPTIVPPALPPRAPVAEVPTPSTTATIPTTTEFTRDQLNTGLRDQQYRKIVFLTGAGISVAAGIPDFRSPGTGLYSRLQELNLPYPEAVFQLDFFRKNPRPFYEVAKSFLTMQVQPVQAHHFITKLAERQQLLMNFTQNIDGLELDAGLSLDYLIQAHGHMRSAHCIDCQQEYPISEFMQYLERSEIYQCPSCVSQLSERPSNNEDYFGLIKPDIVFFGEKLPRTFFNSAETIQEADLVIVMGTSLKVFPFAFLLEFISNDVPVVLINRENPGVARDHFLFLEGDIEAHVTALASEAGIVLPSPVSTTSAAGL
jgi:NAD+-dependent protein deacetylase SIR2